MIEILIVSCLALAAAVVVLLMRLHRERGVDEMIHAMARINARTRAAIDSLEAQQRKQRTGIRITRYRDLGVFWWNSRLFVQISNELVNTAKSGEVHQIAARISDDHKELLKLVVVSCWERLMENVLRIRLGQYQGASLVCYADAEDALGYLIAFWRPESESIFGEKL